MQFCWLFELGEGGWTSRRVIEGKLGVMGSLFVPPLQLASDWGTVFLVRGAARNGELSRIDGKIGEGARLQCDVIRLSLARVGVLTVCVGDFERGLE